MSSLNEFLGREPDPVTAPQRGESVDIGYMCACGSSNVNCFSMDRFKTATAHCLDCGVENKVTIPAWLRELLGG